MSYPGWYKKSSGRFVEQGFYTFQGLTVKSESWLYMSLSNW